MNLLSSFKESLGGAAASVLGGAAGESSGGSGKWQTGGCSTPKGFENMSDAALKGTPKSDKASNLLGYRILNAFSDNALNLLDSKKAETIVKRFGSANYVRALGAVIDDPSGPFQEFVLRVEDAFLSYVYSQKATYQYIDTILSTFSEAVADKSDIDHYRGQHDNVTSTNVDDAALTEACVYAHNPVAHIKLAIRVLAQNDPMHFVEIIEELSDKSVARYNNIVSAGSASSEGGGRDAVDNASRWIIRSKPFRRQMLKDHAESLSVLLASGAYNCSFMVLADEPCIEVLHIMRSMFSSAAGTVGGASNSADIRHLWQQFGVNVIGCGSQQIRGRYLPLLTIAEKDNPCYVHSEGYVLRRLRKSVTTRLYDQFTTAEGQASDCIHMFVWVLMHPRLRVVYYYCITVDPTPYPPILGWRVCEVNQLVNVLPFTVVSTALSRNRSGRGVGPAPLISVIADINDIAISPNTGDAGRMTTGGAMSLKPPSVTEVAATEPSIPSNAFDGMRSPPPLYLQYAQSMASRASQRSDVEGSLAKLNTEISINQAISASMDSLDEVEIATTARTLHGKGFPLSAVDFHPLLRRSQKHRRVTNVNSRVLARRRKQSKSNGDVMNSHAVNILGSMEESLYNSPDYIIAQIAKRKSKMRRVQQPEPYSVMDEDCQYHPKNCGKRLDAAIASLEAQFKPLQISKHLLSTCETAKLQLQDEVRMISARKKWLETATGDEILFGLEVPTKPGQPDPLYERQSNIDVISKRRSSLQRVQSRLNRTRLTSSSLDDDDNRIIGGEGGGKEAIVLDEADMDDVEREQCDIYNSFTTDWQLDKLIEKMHQRLRSSASSSSSQLTGIINLFKSHSVDSHDSDASNRSVLALDVPASATQDSATPEPGFLTNSITKLRSGYATLMSSSLSRSSNTSAQPNSQNQDISVDVLSPSTVAVNSIYTNVARSSKTAVLPSSPTENVSSSTGLDNTAVVIDGVSWDSEDDVAASDNANHVLTDNEDNNSEHSVANKTHRQTSSCSSSLRRRSEIDTNAAVADAKNREYSRTNSSSQSSTGSEDEQGRTIRQGFLDDHIMDSRQPQSVSACNNMNNFYAQGDVCAPFAKVLESVITSDFKKNFSCEILGVELRRDNYKHKTNQPARTAPGSAQDYHLVFVVRVTLPDWLPPSCSPLEQFLVPSRSSGVVDPVHTATTPQSNDSEAHKNKKFVDLCRIANSEWKQRSRYSRRRVFTLRKDIAALCFLHGQLTAVVQSHAHHIDAISAASAKVLKVLTEDGSSTTTTSGLSKTEFTHVIQALSKASSSLTMPFFPDSFLLSTVEDRLSTAIQADMAAVTPPSPANEVPFVYAKTIARNVRDQKDVYLTQEWKVKNRVLASQLHLIVDHVQTYLLAVMELAFNTDNYVDLLANHHRQLLQCACDVPIAADYAVEGDPGANSKSHESLNQHISAVSAVAHEVGRIWGSFVSCEVTASYNSLFAISGSTDEYDDHTDALHRSNSFSNNNAGAGLQRRRRANSFEIAAQRASTTSWRRPIWYPHATGGMRVHLLLSSNQVNSQTVLQSASFTNKLLSRLTDASIDSELFRAQNGKCIGCGEKLVHTTGLLQLASSANSVNYVHCLVVGGLLCKKWCMRYRHKLARDHTGADSLNLQIVPHLLIRNWDASLHPLCGAAYTYVCDMMDACLYSISSVNPLLYDGIPAFKVTKNIRHKLIFLMDALLADRNVDANQVLAHLMTVLGQRGLHLCMSTDIHSLSDLLAMMSSTGDQSPTLRKLDSLLSSRRSRPRSLATKLQELVVVLVKLVDDCKRCA